MNKSSPLSISWFCVLYVSLWLSWCIKQIYKLKKGWKCVLNRRWKTFLHNLKVPTFNFSSNSKLQWCSCDFETLIHNFKKIYIWPLAVFLKLYIPPVRLSFAFITQPVATFFVFFSFSPLFIIFMFLHELFLLVTLQICLWFYRWLTKEKW